MVIRPSIYLMAAERESVRSLLYHFELSPLSIANFGTKTVILDEGAEQENDVKSSQTCDSSLSPSNSASRLGQVSLVVQVCVGQGRHGVAQVLGQRQPRGEVRVDQDGDGHRRGGRDGRGARGQVRGHRQPGRQVSHNQRVE